MKRTSILAAGAVAILFMSVLTTSVLAGKGGVPGGGGGGSGGGSGGGGGGKPPPGPAGCATSFPSFAYRSSPGVAVAAVDGCLLGFVAEVGGAPHLHRYGNGAAESSSGAVFFEVENNGLGKGTFARVGFEIDSAGTLTAGPQVPLLSAPGDAGPGETVYFHPVDVWGSPDSSTAYLSTIRWATAADGTLISADWRVYEVDETGVVAYRTLLSDVWDEGSLGAFASCPDVAFPHQVPGCYRIESGSIPEWHPSGSRFYIEGGQGGGEHTDLWQSTMRMDINNRAPDGSLLPLQDWTFQSPEMVYIGTFAIGDEIGAVYREPGGAVVRPPATSTAPELIGMTYFDFSGRSTTRHNAVLDADACVDKYSAYSDGITGPVHHALWLECVDSSFYLDHLASLTGRFDRMGTVWQSPDAVLDYGAFKNATAVYRRHVRGNLAGTSELLVQNGAMPHTGQ